MNGYYHEHYSPKGPSLSLELQVCAKLPQQLERTMLSRDLVPSLFSLPLGSQLNTLL